NSQAMIAAGDEVAVKLFEDHNKLVMTAFPSLSDENIKNIFAYVDEASKPAPAAEGGAEGGAAGAAANDDVSNFMFGGLVLVLIIAFLVILVLNRVIRTLDKIILRNQDAINEQAEEEEGESQSQVLVNKIKVLSKNKKLVFVVILGVVAI